MELKGSRTEANLMAAFAGESQARNKYTYYASKAKKDGFEQIAAIFEETANNEKEHAKILVQGISMAEPLPIPPPIWKTPHRARTMSGRKCTRSLPKWLRKRASRRLQPSCA